MDLLEEIPVVRVIKLLSLHRSGDKRLRNHSADPLPEGYRLLQERTVICSYLLHRALAVALCQRKTKEWLEQLEPIQILKYF